MNTNFPHVEVISLPNGEGWTPQKLAEHIGSLFRTKDINAQSIVVWFDRESNGETSNQIKKLIYDKFTELGVTEEILNVCIPDKMTENVILADEMLIKEEFKLENYIYKGDGTNGKSDIKLLYSEKKGIKYKETLHGVKLLKKLHLSRAASKSPSVKNFVESLSADCWWKR